MPQQDSAELTNLIAKNLTRKTKKKGPGPGQAEQKSFESVNAQNMVDLFSGDFSTFGANQGTGGAFTQIGTFTNASRSPGQ